MTSQIFDDILIGSSAVSITDDALVTANAVIGLADGVFDVGMTATGSGHVIEVLGAIYGSVTSLIMGANASAFSDNQLIVGSTGMLFTTGDGVLILGGQSSVDNAGAINGESGIILHAVSGATTSTIPIPDRLFPILPPIRAMPASCMSAARHWLSSTPA